MAGTCPAGHAWAPITAQMSLVSPQLSGPERPSVPPVPPHVSPKIPQRGSSKTNQHQDGQKPAPPACANSSGQTLSIPDGWVSSSRADRRKKKSSSPFLAVSISSSVQRELSFISREAGRKKERRALSKPSELRDAQTPKACPVPGSPEARQNAVPSKHTSFCREGCRDGGSQGFSTHSNPCTASPRDASQ